MTVWLLLLGLSLAQDGESAPVAPTPASVEAAPTVAPPTPAPVPEPAPEPAPAPVPTAPEPAPEPAPPAVPTAPEPAPPAVPTAPEPAPAPVPTAPDPAPAPVPTAPDPAPPSPPAPALPPPAPSSLSPAPEPAAVPAPAMPGPPAPSPPLPQLIQPILSLDLTESLLPWVPHRGFRHGAMLALFTVMCMAGARWIGRLREKLLDHGLLPRLFVWTQLALRLLSFIFGFGATVALIPASIASALPWALLACAAAVGWSARDFLPDLVAGLLLSLERRIEPGQWVSGEGYAGVVERVGIRATWLRDAVGRQVAIPNRRLLREPVVSDSDRWPAIEVVVDVPSTASTSEVRQALLEAVLLSPWLAPDQQPTLVREMEKPGRWRVRSRLLEGRYADRFEGALRERVEELLLRTPPEEGKGAEG